MDWKDCRQPGIIDTIVLSKTEFILVWVSDEAERKHRGVFTNYGTSLVAGSVKGLIKSCTDWISSSISGTSGCDSNGGRKRDIVRGIQAPC